MMENKYKVIIYDGYGKIDCIEIFDTFEDAYIFLQYYEDIISYYTIEYI